MWVIKMAGNLMLMLVVWNVTMMTMKGESSWGLTMGWDLPTGVRLSQTKVMDSLQLVSPVETQYRLVTN